MMEVNGSFGILMDKLFLKKIFIASSLGFVVLFY